VPVRDATPPEEFPQLERLLAEGWRAALERQPLRTREGANTRSGWRLCFASESATGSIVLVELEDGRTVYRGDGAFLGWSQEQLGEAYRRTQPKPDEPPFEPAQLG
jgi:hypothetical protein